MVRDDLQSWLHVREKVDWTDVPHGLAGPIRGRRDGLLTAAALRDTPGDSTRGDRLRTAWERARCDAAAGACLGFHLLCEWQKLVLGLPDVGFRTLPAFAKAGRERYGLSAETPRLFHGCLAESADMDVPLAGRAARVYLDVCFFHPFHDGNGRAALLALGFVLAREEVFLDEVGPIQVRRYADDPVGAASLARVVHTLAMATVRRSRSNQPVEPPNSLCAASVDLSARTRPVLRRAPEGGPLDPAGTEAAVTQERD
ncbi:Fic family protein [Streptomyces sp. AF1A]|uniref:Fic family protein n=1 Tax=Streptomyces sp. AF1A TaxID=3394350 RepID=UPI0039BD895D